MDVYSGWETVENSYEFVDDKLDVIIVLAGGLNDKGMVHEWVRRRLDKAYEMHKIYDIPIIICGGGTYHKPPYFNKQNYVVHESTECANYLIQKGVKPENIFREWSSYDTIANAFFSLTNHIWCRKWTHIALITSEFHMPRTKAIFEWVYGLEGGNIYHSYYSFKYYSVTDKGLGENMIKSRSAREEESLKNVLKLREKIGNIEEFHSWLFTEHNAYNNKPITKENISPACKNSY